MLGGVGKKKLLLQGESGGLERESISSTRSGSTASGGGSSSGYLGPTFGLHRLLHGSNKRVACGPPKVEVTASPVPLPDGLLYTLGNSLKRMGADYH